MLGFIKLYRIKNEFCNTPEERLMVYVITNKNEVTGRVDIVPINTDLPIPPIETVSMDHVEEMTFGSNLGGKTMGDTIQEMYRAYADTYEYFKKDEQFKDDAGCLARADLMNMIWKCESALEHLNVYIADHP